MCKIRMSHKLKYIPGPLLTMYDNEKSGLLYSKHGIKDFGSFCEGL